MSLRLLAVAALLPSLLVPGAKVGAEPPRTDTRNEQTPHTDTRMVRPEFRSLAEWEARRKVLRAQILAAAGLHPLPERTPLRPEVFGRLEREGYTVEKVLLETLPGFYLGGNLYRPRGTASRHPGVLKAHGHWNYGRLEHQPLAEQQTLCANLARQGYVVFNYDMVGYNDTVQTPHSFGGPREDLWSFGPLGLQLWNSIRALDFLQSLADVDPDRIGMTGASGGGTQTFLLYAVDERVRCAAPVNMISGIMQGGDPCENAPGLRVGTSNVEIGAMMAPWPLLMVSATGDWTKNTPQEEFPAIRRAYALFGKPEAVENAHFDAPHNFHQGSREAVYRFFARHLLGEAGGEQVPEQALDPEPLQNVLALHGRALPEGALTFDQLFASWRQMSDRQVAAMSDRAALRAHLSRSIGVSWPARVDVARNGEAVVLGRFGQGDRVSGAYIKGRGRPVLVLHPEGARAARAAEETRALLVAKRPVLVIDAFQTGDATAPRDRTHRYFSTFNLTDDACRLQDVLTALRFLQEVAKGPVEVQGLGHASQWALLGAALAPRGVLLRGDEPRGVTDEDLVRDLFVPGLNRGGGIAAAARLVVASP